MVKQLALAEDKAFLTGAGSAYSPKGMTTLAGSNRTTTVATLSDVNNLLAAMELDLMANNIDTTGAKWVFHPTVRAFLSSLTDSVGRYFFREELDRGTLFGYEYRMSTQLATNLGSNNSTTMIFVQPSEFIIGDTLSLVADASSEASYIDGGNGLASTFSRYQTAFRVLEEVDANVKHTQAISVATVAGMHPSFYLANSAGSAFINTTGTDNSPSAAPSASAT